ncbi:MAG: ABC transporter ATP-binding protein [Chromatiales bacterium]|nr:ABC transporter ATP-binding protein [Chromatiales bacterium]
MSEPMLLQIDDLSVGFGTTLAVDRIAMDIRPGECVALVGESGSGKSVTAHSILRLLPYPAAHHPSGRILLHGEDLLHAPEHRLRQVRGEKIAMIFQEPMTSLNPLHTVERQIGETLAVHKGMVGSKARKRILELLDMVGIRDPESRLGSYPHQLSGGQRQRVMIAMALANEPELLIADEPTTALDVTVQAQILRLLDKLRQDLGMAVLLITHDLGIVRHFAQRVCVMQAGKLVEKGETKRIFNDPQHAYTRHLLSAEPGDKPGSAPAHAPEVMRAKDLKVWFPIRRGVLRRTVDHFRAVDGVDLSVREGHTVGVVGESGSGKTTLGLALLRLQSSRGDIVFQNRSLQELRGKQLRPLRKEMQIVFQDPFSSLNPRMSVGRIVGEGLEVHESSLGETEREGRIIAALDEVGLDPQTRHRFPHEFSGGQRQRIAIARAMVLKPRFVVLDEPTSALDRSVQAQIIDLLRELQTRHGLAYLFISHDLKVVRAISDEVLVMRGGRVLERGDSQQIFKNPQHPYTRSLLEAAFDL